MVHWQASVVTVMNIWFAHHHKTAE